MTNTDIREARAREAEGRGAVRHWSRGWQPLLAVVLLVVGAFVLGQRLSRNAPSDSSAAAGFARDMSVHHDQAVQMAEIVRSRTTDPLVRGLATEIVLIQQAQIGQMRGWLDVWGLSPTGSDARMAWMGDPVSDFSKMPGMASQEQLRQLEQLPPAEMDIMFLRLMIQHHQGGTQMATAGLELVDQPVVRALADAIVKSQQYEMSIMQDMLRRMGGTPPADLPPMTMEHADGHSAGFTASVRPVMTETLRLAPVMLGILAAGWLAMRWLADQSSRTQTGGRVGTWRVVALAGLLTSAFLHMGLAPKHFAESTAFGVFFTLSAVALGWLAILIAVRPSRMVYLAGMTTSLVLIGVYLMFRFVPPPGMGASEEFDLIGVSTKAAEVTALVACAVLWQRARDVGLDRRVSSGRNQRLQKS